jgi:hypothetical protein
MTGEIDAIATDGPTRRRHDHRFPGVNVALLDWPEKDAQSAAIHADLDAAIQTRVCLGTDLRPVVILDNVMGGHSWPSGDASTRRAWVELVAYSGATEIYRSGVIADGTSAVSTLESDADLWLLRDRLLSANGDEATFTWEATDLDSDLLPPAVTADPSDPRFYHAVSRTYPTLPDTPDRMTLRVHIRPIGLDVIDALIGSGDLDQRIRTMIPTLTLQGSILEWQGALGDCEPPLTR